MSKMRTERMLFHLPRGSKLGHGFGGVRLDEAAILAFSGTDEDNPDGLYAVHGETMDAEDTLERLDINFIPDGYAGSKKGNGQWVYEVTYDEADVPPYDADADPKEQIEYLRGGTIRRMTAEEVKRLAEEDCPFNGGIAA